MFCIEAQPCSPAKAHIKVEPLPSVINLPEKYPIEVKYLASVVVAAEEVPIAIDLSPSVLPANAEFPKAIRFATLFPALFPVFAPKKILFIPSPVNPVSPIHSEEALVAGTLIRLTPFC